MNITTKPKILFIIGTLDMGGAEHQMVQIIEQIKDEFECEVLCLYKTGPLIERLEKQKIIILN